MSKVRIVSEIGYKDTGLEEFSFMDKTGKIYKVLPKPGHKSDLEAYLKFIKFICPKQNLSPFQYTKKHFFEIEPENKKREQKPTKKIKWRN